ncbi:unnamed protein product [Scytosiphon promiscuus]
MRLQQKTALQKVGVLVRAGMMEPPKWYAAAKQVPPFQRRPSNGVKVLKLPWDTLANEFVSRNPHMVEDPEWLGPRGFKPGAPPISYVFAKRQYAFMQNGAFKEEAYKRAHEAMKKERAEDVAAVQEMVREASTMSGSRPSFMADDDVYSGLKFWQSMMQETPYADWDLAAKQGLDVFLRTELVGWDDDRVKLAQSAKDGTAAALTAEINRLRVTLFPETKTSEYAYPSDVVRPLHEDDDEVDDDSGTGDRLCAAVDVAPTGRRLAPPARFGSWKATLRRFEEMTKESGYELDWSGRDRRSLDNFVVGRCIRRSVLDEAFTWVPDPISDALAKVRRQLLYLAPTVGTSLCSRQKTSVEGLRPALMVDVVDERWMSSAELEDFSGNWMDIARRRTGRTVTGLSAATGERGKARDVGGPLAQRPTLALQSNLRAVLSQAKRQVLPDLVLEVDEKTGPISADERKAKDAAMKKIVMSALEWEQEELENQRMEVTRKMRAGMTVDQIDPVAAVRKKRLAKGTWKAERRRLLKLEKKLYSEQQANMDYEQDDRPEHAVPEPIDDVLESEIVRRQADDMYAKEKARMKRELKLRAEAAATAKAVKEGSSRK